MVKKNNRLEWFNHWRQDRVKPFETWNSYCTWSSRGPEGHHVARANEALRDVPSIKKLYVMLYSSKVVICRKPLSIPFLYVVGTELQHRVCTFSTSCACFQNDIWLWFVETIVTPFLSVVGTELAQSAHTHTSQRDVKQILLSELFDSVCADSVYTYLSPRENLNIIYNQPFDSILASRCQCLVVASCVWCFSVHLQFDTITVERKIATGIW